MNALAGLCQTPKGVITQIPWLWFRIKSRNADGKSVHSFPDVARMEQN